MLRQRQHTMTYRYAQTRWPTERPRHTNMVTPKNKTSAPRRHGWCSRSGTQLQHTQLHRRLVQYTHNSGRCRNMTRGLTQAHRGCDNPRYIGSLSSSLLFVPTSSSIGSTLCGWMPPAATYKLSLPARARKGGKGLRRAAGNRAVRTDRDAHAVGAEVPEAQDAAAVRQHDHRDVVDGPVVHHRLHLWGVRRVGHAGRGRQATHCASTPRPRRTPRCTCRAGAGRWSRTAGTPAGTAG
jgi:hypothetical protein